MIKWTENINKQADRSIYEFLNRNICTEDGTYQKLNFLYKVFKKNACKNINDYNTEM
jgi:hypothetical protein